MDGVQANEEDFLSIQYARRLQEQYDNETPLKRKAPTQDRGLIDEQRSAFEQSCAVDKAAALTRKAQETVKEAAVNAAKEAAIHAAKEAVQEVVKPLSSAEMRERRIKAFSTPSAN